MSERRLETETPHSPGWPGWAGIALALFALWRSTVNDAWDGWCTLAAVLSAVGLTVWALGRRALLQREARTRSARFGGQTLASAALLLAALALVNFLAARHNAAFDLTEAGFFTLAPQTRQAVKALKRDVRLLAFFPSSRSAQAADLLRRYAELSPRLRYELIDPDQEPDTAQKYGVTAYGTVVVDVERAPGEKGGPPVRVEAEPGERGGLTLSEEKLTNALLKVARSGPKTVYFLEGHGEGDIHSEQLNGYARVRAALENQAFAVRTLFLARAPQVPADCSALILAGPGSEPLPDEMTALQRYLEQGGTALLLVDPAPGAGLESFLHRWGVKVGRDLVVDASGAGRTYGAGPAMPLVKDYNPQHPITRDFRLMTFFPLARSLTPEENPGDADAVPLAQTGPQSFAEPYTGGGRRPRFDPARDKRGPISLAVAVSRAAANGKEARLVAIGSSNFVSNAFFDRAGNGDLFLNAVNWLAEEEALIAIRPRPRQDHRVQLTEQQARGIFWLTVVGMPAAALAAGAFVFWRRR
jgi:ABC-type uncharacterized transport system involved in gliding motility auxiliary subunit